MRALARMPKRRLGVAVVGLMLAAAVLAPAALAHPFTASIAATTAGTGNVDTYTATITNKFSSSSKPTKATLAIPSGWAVDAGSVVVATTDGAPWAATVDSGLITLTSTNGLPYTKALTFSFRATAPCTPGASVWTPKLSRGSTQWSISGATPTVTVSAPGRLATFAWSTAPAAAQVAGTAITGTVLAKDACGNTTPYAGAGQLLDRHPGQRPERHGGEVVRDLLGGGRRHGGGAHLQDRVERVDHRRPRRHGSADRELLGRSRPARELHLDGAGLAAAGRHVVRCVARGVRPVRQREDGLQRPAGLARRARHLARAHRPRTRRPRSANVLGWPRDGLRHRAIGPRRPR